MSSCLSFLLYSYEAYVIYTFFSLLVAYIGGNEVLKDYLELKSHLRHPWPFSNCIRPMNLNRYTLTKLRRGILQFVIVKPFTALLATVYVFFRN